MMFIYIVNYLVCKNIALFGGIVRDFILSKNFISKTVNDIDCIMSEKQYNQLFRFLKRFGIQMPIFKCIF